MGALTTTGGARQGTMANRHIPYPADGVRMLTLVLPPLLL
jgi:hypothetical protein